MNNKARIPLIQTKSKTNLENSKEVKMGKTGYRRHAWRPINIWGHMARNIKWWQEKETKKWKMMVRRWCKMVMTICCS